MLLIGCTAGAFTACSDGDDDQKPSCPITEYTVPSTAEMTKKFYVSHQKHPLSVLCIHPMYHIFQGFSRLEPHNISS